MAISEAQLETWSHQGSVIQSASTYETIKNALQDNNSPYASKKFDVFLQGSYGNDTNIYADSDVDVVIRLSSVYYSDLTKLNEEEKSLYKKHRTDGTDTFSAFKAEVLSWLTAKFGSGVNAGSKAIFLPDNGNRRKVDVLVCVKHRSYYKYSGPADARYHDGVCFWTDKGKKIVNYPKQHMSNSTTKHQGCNQRFKPTVRTLKNIRNGAIEAGYLREGVAPSYYLDGLLYNVPPDLFVNSCEQTFINYIKWLDQCNRNELLCANKRHYLLRDNSPVCWNERDYLTFREGIVKFWNDA